MLKKNQVLLFVDGSHYDRLRSVFEAPLDLRKLAFLAADGKSIDKAVYYRDRRDAKEEERLQGLFGWLRHNGFIVKSRRHGEGEPRERYGTNLLDMAVDALQFAHPGDSVMLIAGDGKLVPLCLALTERGVHVTLLSTLDAPVTIAPPQILLDVVDSFVEVADLLDAIAVSPSGRHDDAALDED
jgi:uncharacterized LabA/DUF88 family protein